MALTQACEETGRASDRMTKEVVCVLRGDSLADVHGLMTELRVRHLPVVDDGRLVGLVSDRDVLVRAQLAPDGSGRLVFREPLTAGDVMTTALVTCRESASLADVARQMLEAKIDCVPVTDDASQLRGMLTSSDLLAAFVAKMETAAAEPLPFEFRMRRELDLELPESLI